MLRGLIMISLYPRVFATSLHAPSVKILATFLLEDNPVIKQLFFVRKFLGEQRLALCIIYMCDMFASRGRDLFHLLFIPDEIIRQVVRCIPKIVKAITR